MRRVVSVAIAGRHFDVIVSQRDRNVWTALGEFGDREIGTMDRSFDGAVERWRANATEGALAQRQAA
ncbi:hypothetical protein RB623_03305 [Mesorhizobium sp. LHD-90]|uniref:hypothetical protein n=1 Tax=Mesorhizobium sp. LHD-90 TaxID=3071414 RepID=UPI0027E0F740|nr:hypothetical protein [Mesorhizobium sp. LHD-90]MDQ6433076.1 hypothetical protein [Mesorhizobium sp. LHD-90]